MKRLHEITHPKIQNTLKFTAKAEATLLRPGLLKVAETWPFMEF